VLQIGRGALANVFKYRHKNRNNRQIVKLLVCGV
jgi:hypothetical protein